MAEVITTKIEGAIGKAAATIAEEINADYVIAIGKLEDADEENLFFEVRVSIFKRVKPNTYSKDEYVSKIKKPESGTIVSMKEILRQAIAQKMIQKGERVVCVQGEGLGSGYKGMLFVFDVDKLFFDISSNKLAEYVDSAVIEAVIDIALELSQEGREGKKVGTAFVIGKQEIMRYTKQLIINPFKNLERDERKVTDPNLRETMKEFALLDGIFMIDEDGTILSAGTYLDVDTEGLELPSGLGTRHRNCAAITAKSDALAVCVSESGGKVRVFKGGKIVMSM